MFSVSAKQIVGNMVLFIAIGSIHCDSGQTQQQQQKTCSLLAIFRVIGNVFLVFFLCVFVFIFFKTKPHVLALSFSNRLEPFNKYAVGNSCISDNFQSSKSRLPTQMSCSHVDQHNHMWNIVAAVSCITERHFVWTKQRVVQCVSESFE